MFFSKNKEKIIEIVFLIVLLVEFVFLIWANLFKIPATIDNDSAKVFTHAVEMFRWKTPFVPGWVNQTTLELDCTTLIAIPIYAAIHNIILSFGIANIILTITYFLVIGKLLNRMGVKKAYKYITLTLVITPYSFGQLSYYNMMFFSAGQYVLKVLVPLMMMVVMSAEVDIKKGLKPVEWVKALAENNREDIICAVFCLIFLFVCTISSGPYVLMGGLLPIAIGYAVYDFGKKEKIKEALLDVKILFLLASMFVALAGMKVFRHKCADTVGNNITLIKRYELFDSFGSKMEAFFYILGGVKSEACMALSVDGISYLIRFVFCILMLVAIIYYGVLAIRDFSASKEKQKTTMIEKYIVVQAIINFLVLLVTDLYGQPRYFLISVVPCMILVVGMIEKMFGGFRLETQKVLFTVGFATFLIMIVLLSNKQVLKDECDPYFTPDEWKWVNVLDYVKSEPETHIITLDDTGLAEVFRALDDEDSLKKYITYSTEYQDIAVHGYYWSDSYREWLAQPFLLVCCDSYTSIDLLPDELRNRCEKVYECQNYWVYRVK